MERDLRSGPAVHRPGQEKDGYRRLAAAAAFASLMSYALVLCITPAAINEIGRSFAVSASHLAWLYRAMMLGFFGAVIAGGRYADRNGKLPVVLAGCVLMALGAYVFARTPGFSGAVAAMLLMGIGGGFAEGMAMAVVSDLYAGSRRTAMLNWAQVVFAIGAIAAPLAIARLIKTGLDWRIGFSGVAAACGIGALVSLAAAVLRHEPPPARSRDHIGWGGLLRDRLVIQLSVGIMLYVGAENAQASWLAAYFEKGLNSSAAVAAASVAFFWAGIGSGRAAAAWLSRHVSDFDLICWSLGLAAACQAVLLLLNGPVAALVASTALGFALAPVWPTILSRAGEAHSLQTGTVFGIIVAFGALGAAIFTPAVGRLADEVGIRLALWVCVAVLVANLALFARLRASTRQTRR